MKKIIATQDTYLKVLMYGQPGSTKTRTAATAALDERTAPALLLNMGGNPLSIADYEEQPDIYTMSDMRDFNAVFDFLERGMPLNHQMVTQFDARNDYKTVIIDGITDVNRDAMEKATGTTAKGVAELLPAQQIQHYGQVLRMTTRFARLFYNLPMHVIVTALEKEDRDDTSGSIYYRPLVYGQGGGELAAYAYTVARMMHVARVSRQELKTIGESGVEGIGAATSVAIFQPSGKIMAKDQAGMQIPYMMDPTVTKMLDLIESNRSTGKSRKG